MLRANGSGSTVGDDGVPGDPIGPAFPNATKGIAMAGMAIGAQGNLEGLWG